MERAIGVEVISFCGADGAIRPLRFRFRDEEQQIRTVHVTEIVSAKEVEYAGLAAFSYICRGALAETMRHFELRYGVKTHQWTLVRSFTVS